MHPRIHTSIQFTEDAARTRRAESAAATCATRRDALSRRVRAAGCTRDQLISGALRNTRAACLLLTIAAALRIVHASLAHCPRLHGAFSLSIAPSRAQSSRRSPPSKSKTEARHTTTSCCGRQLQHRPVLALPAAQVSLPHRRGSPCVRRWRQVPLRRVTWCDSTGVASGAQRPTTHCTDGMVSERGPGPRAQARISQ